MLCNLLLEFISLFCGFNVNILHTTPIMSNVVYIDENCCEPNDTLEDATNISYDECYNGVDWDSIVSGNLDSRFHDNDIFYFSLVSEYEVSINLNIDSNVIPFDFSICYIEYESLYDNQAIKRTV